MKTTAKFVKEIRVKDPDTNEKVSLAVFKHVNGGMFAIDASFLEQAFEDDENIEIHDPFVTGEVNPIILRLEE